MKRILGLDLGTTSIGWALVNEAENKEEKSSIVKLGVRIVPLSENEQNYNKGKNIETNAARTMKRSMRRNNQRYKLRRATLKEHLTAQGWITEQTPLCEDGPRTTFETYRLRAKATTDEITLEEFARVLLMINKKRGYRSSRETANDEAGALIDGMDVAKQLYVRNITPGEYVLELLQSGNKTMPEFYRSDLLDELNKVWSTQSHYYPAILTDDFKNTIIGRNKNDVKKIFYARYKINTAPNNGKNKKLQTYQWRVQALTDQLPIDQMAYVICDICEHFAKQSTYLGNIGDRSKELFFKQKTVGQYLMERLDSNPNESLKNLVFYRQDYEDEFNTLWNTQAKYHPELTPELKSKVDNEIIFYQRHRKSQHHLIRQCELEPQLKVCPKSSPLFQEFKIWQKLNDLTLNGAPISIEKKELLAAKLNTVRKISKTEVIKLLIGKEDGYDINFSELSGNETFAAMIEACPDLPKQFLTFDCTLEGKEFCNQPALRLWHLLYSYNDDYSKTGDRKLVELVMKLTGLQEDQAKVLSKIRFDRCYGSFSAKALRKILKEMKKGYQYSKACNSLTREELDTRELKDQAELLKRNELRNPVVEKILNQMIHVVNAVCEQYGKPDEIRVEMARELKKSKKERAEMSKSIKDTTDKNNVIRELLIKEFGIPHPSNKDIIKYRLYKELEENDYKTLYTNTFIPRNKLFDNDIEVEHIIPKARLFDDSFSNKTIEAKAPNNEKGIMTALDYVTDITDAKGVEQYKDRVNKLLKCKAISKTKARKLLMTYSDIPEKFLKRDLDNTQYIARKAIEILEQLVRTVTTTTGSITDRLRKDWHLTDLMKELNWDKYNRMGKTFFYENRDGHLIGQIKDWTKRNDHRHHAMDALTIAFTRPEIINYLNNMSARSDKNGLIYKIEHHLTYRDSDKNRRFYPPMPLDEFSAEAKRHLEAILVSIKAKNKVVTTNENRYQVGSETRCKVQLTPRISLHEDNIYSKSKQYETKEVKVGKDMTMDVAQQVACAKYREAILSRLEAFGGDAKKAFTGKNSLDKNPLWLDEMHTQQVPAKVKIVWLKDVYTIRKAIDDTLNVDNVVDSQIRQILKARLAEFGEDKKKAFANLKENPIWLNEEKGIDIKRVTVINPKSHFAIRSKKNIHGKIITDEVGKPIPSDYVASEFNHHSAIYVDKKGNLHDVIVPFIEATKRYIQGLPVICKDYKHNEGWHFIFTLKRNEYVVFSNPDKGFFPKEIDLTDPTNASKISENLYTVQQISKNDYMFCHHLFAEKKKNKNIDGEQIKRYRKLIDFVKDIVKVRINHLGQVVSVGEY